MSNIDRSSSSTARVARRAPTSSTTTRTPGLFSRFSTTQLGGMAIRATLEHTQARQGARRPRRDGHGAAQPPRLDLRRAGDALARRARRRRAGAHGRAHLRQRRRGDRRRRRDDPRRPAPRHERARSSSSAAPRACSTRSASTTSAARRSARRSRSTARSTRKTLPPGTHLQDMLLMSLYDPRRKHGHGEHRRGARAALRDHARAGRRVRLPLAAAREAGARRRLVRRGDRAGDGRATARPSRSSVKHDTHILDDASLAKMARLPAGLRAGRHHHRRQRQRRRRRRRRDGDRQGDRRREARRQAARAHRRHGRRRAAIRRSWAGARCPRRSARSSGRASSGKAIDHVELNEAFAPQALACIRDFEKMGIDPGEGEPAGRRHRPRPPARRDRRDPHAHLRLRAAARPRSATASSRCASAAARASRSCSRRCKGSATILRTPAAA